MGRTVRARPEGSERRGEGGPCPAGGLRAVSEAPSRRFSSRPQGRPFPLSRAGSAVVARLRATRPPQNSGRPEISRDLRISTDDNSRRYVLPFEISRDLALPRSSLSLSRRRGQSASPRPRGSIIMMSSPGAAFPKAPRGLCRRRRAFRAAPGRLQTAPAP